MLQKQPVALPKVHFGWYATQVTSCNQFEYHNRPCTHFGISFVSISCSVLSLHSILSELNHHPTKRCRTLQWHIHAFITYITLNYSMHSLLILPYLTPCIHYLYYPILLHAFITYITLSYSMHSLLTLPILLHAFITYITLTHCIHYLHYPKRTTVHLCFMNGVSNFAAGTLYKECWN